MDHPRSTTWRYSWENTIWWVNHYLNRLDTGELLSYYNNGKHHGIWLLGHLVASEDDFSIYVSGEDMLFPEYKDLFASGTAVQEFSAYPSTEQLLEAWSQVCSKNEKIYHSLTDDQLDQPHLKMKEGDFFKTVEGIIKNWQAHQLHHSGHLALLKKK